MILQNITLQNAGYEDALTKARDAKNIRLQNTGYKDALTEAKDVLNCTLVQYKTTYINFLLLPISSHQKINFILLCILKILLTYHFEVLADTQEGCATNT